MIERLQQLLLSRSRNQVAQYDFLREISEQSTFRTLWVLREQYQRFVAAAPISRMTQPAFPAAHGLESILRTPASSHRGRHPLATRENPPYEHNPRARSTRSQSRTVRFDDRAGISTPAQHANPHVTEHRFREEEQYYPEAYNGTPHTRRHVQEAEEYTPGFYRRRRSVSAEFGLFEGCEWRGRLQTRFECGVRHCRNIHLDDR